MEILIIRDPISSSWLNNYDIYFSSGIVFYSSFFGIGIVLCSRVFLFIVVGIFDMVLLLGTLLAASEIPTVQ
jgi:hypothetical protein